MTPPSRRPTSADVARLAGVSRTTVSYILSGDPDRPIGEETRRRVLAAVHELGYTPHASARTLRAGRSNVVLVPMPAQPLAPARSVYLEVLDRELVARGLTLLIHGDRTASGLDGARRWAELRPAAVLVEAERCPQEGVEMLERAGVDLVLLESPEPLPYARTIPLGRGAVADRAARHLLGRGHRKLACLVPGGELAQLGRDRFDAVTSAAGAAGVPVQRVDCDLTLESFAPAVGAWRDPALRPDAVYAYNDEFALVLIQALRDAGLRVPDDIAVVGSDNLPLGAALRPTLTSTYLDVTGGAAAVATLVRCLLDGEEPDPALCDVAQPGLVVRESG